MSKRFLSGAGGKWTAMTTGVDVLTRQDPKGLELMPSREDYIINKPQITFSKDLSPESWGSHF